MGALRRLIPSCQFPAFGPESAGDAVRHPPCQRRSGARGSKYNVCHTVTDGGKNGIGPNLWNMVNAEPASRPASSIPRLFTG